MSYIRNDWGLVHTFILLIDYSKLPEGATLASRQEVFGRVNWLIGRLLISAVAGLMLGLYLVGALTNSPTTTARILAFSILVGYAAPRLWITQDSIVTEAIETRVRKILEEYGFAKKTSNVP